MYTTLILNKCSWVAIQTQEVHVTKAFLCKSMRTHLHKSKRQFLKNVLHIIACRKLLKLAMQLNLYYVNQKTSCRTVKNKLPLNTSTSAQQEWKIPSPVCDFSCQILINITG